MSDSSSSELEELGINLQEFSKKRQVRLGAQKTIQYNTQDMQVPQEIRYEALLNLGISILRKDSSEPNKIKLPLEVKREGRKTVINITTIADILHRSVDHLVRYITKELSTNGAVNQEGKLWIKGNFISTEVQEVIRRYIEHFVVCKICDNIENTEIVKENKLYFLKCHKCGGQRCVGNVIEGLTSKGCGRPQLRGML